MEQQAFDFLKTQGPVVGSLLGLLICSVLALRYVARQARDERTEAAKALATAHEAAAVERRAATEALGAHFEKLGVRIEDLGKAVDKNTLSTDRLVDRIEARVPLKVVG